MGANVWASDQPQVDETPKRSLPPAVAATAGSGWSDMIGVTRRNLTFLRRTPQALFCATVQPVLMLLTLNAVFGGLVSRVGGGPYIQYLLPGMVVMNVMLNAGMTAFGIAADLQTGIIDRFRSLPMSRSAVLLGRTIADLARNALALALLVLVGFAMGYLLHGSLAAGITALAVVLLFAYSTSWLFASVGLAVKDPQAAQFASFAPVLPLVFLSGAWIPVATMAGGLQAFARNQPVNVAVEAVRALGNGAPAFHWVWLSVAWSTGILAVFWILAVRQFRTAAR
jgi:ABC transporter DrrB family efflux protein